MQKWNKLAGERVFWSQFQPGAEVFSRGGGILDAGINLVNGLTCAVAEFCLSLKHLEPIWL